MPMRASTALCLIAATLLGGTAANVQGAATIEKVWLSDLDISKTQRSWGSMSGKMRVRDLWRQKDLGAFDGRFETEVPRHGAVLIRLFPAG